ncbi:MAG: hypothetical protein WA213_20890 [Terriglobales bacterium]
MATVIYNCKGCKTGKRVEYPIEQGKGCFFRRDASGNLKPSTIYILSCGGGRPTEYAGDVEMGICSGCGKMMTPGMLNGFVRPDHKCNGACVNSRGPNCDCSCGGANHGKGWAA